MHNGLSFKVLSGVAAGLGLVVIALQLSDRKAVKDIQRRLPITESEVVRLSEEVIARLKQQIEQVEDVAAGELPKVLLKLGKYPTLIVGAALIAHLEGLSRAHAAAERDLVKAREAQLSGAGELMPDEIQRLEALASDLRAKLELAAAEAAQWQRKQQREQDQDSASD